MRILIQGADNPLIENLLPLLTTPAVLVDLRQGTEQIVPWQGDDLPVYHSYDALAGLCEWEDALYETCVEVVRAVYAPARAMPWPDETVWPPFSEGIFLADDTPVPEVDITVDAARGAKGIAALWNGEQSIFDRIRSLFKGKKHE